MLKKYIKLFLESSSFQTKNTTNPSYFDIAKQIEDEQGIKDLEASRIINNASQEISPSEYADLLNHNIPVISNNQNQSSQEEINYKISPSEYSDLLNKNNITPSRNYLFNQRPPKKKT